MHLMACILVILSFFVFYLFTVSVIGNDLIKLNYLITFLLLRCSMHIDSTYTHLVYIYRCTYAHLQRNILLLIFHIHTCKGNKDDSYAVILCTASINILLFLFF